MEDYITRTEHNRGIDRLHNRIDPINDSSIRMEESSKRIEDMVKSMHTLMYGNSKEGLIVKVSNLLVRVRTNRWLISVFLVSMLATAGFVIRNVLSK